MRLQDLKADLARFHPDYSVPSMRVARRVADLFEQDEAGHWWPSPKGYEVLTRDCYEGDDVVGSLADFLFGEDT